MKIVGVSLRFRWGNRLAPLCLGSLISILRMTDTELLQLQATLQKSTAYLEQKGIELARREAEWIFSETLHLSRMELYTKFDMLLSPEEANVLRSLIVRRGKREPLAYVLGNQDFCGLKLSVSPAVLVPRPETEELVERILKKYDESTKRFVDIGTGSGAIALAVKHKRPQWDVSGSDISEEALQIAKQNAASCELSVTWQQGDLCEALDGQYDIIVANLPYVAESERELCDPETQFEPALALFAEQEGMALIERLISSFSTYAHPAATLWLEYGFKQADAVRACAEASALRCEIFKDLSGNDRMACLERA